MATSLATGPLDDDLRDDLRDDLEIATRVERGRQVLAALLEAAGEPLLRHFDGVHAVTQDDFVESVEKAVAAAREEMEMKIAECSRQIRQRRRELNIDEEVDDSLIALGHGSPSLDYGSPTLEKEDVRVEEVWRLEVALQEAEDRNVELQRENRELAMKVVWNSIDEGSARDAAELSERLAGDLAALKVDKEEASVKLEVARATAIEFEGRMLRAEAQVEQLETQKAALLEDQRQQSSLIAQLVEQAAEAKTSHETSKEGLAQRLKEQVAATIKAEAQAALALEGQTRQTALIERLKERCDIAEASVVALEHETRTGRVKDLKREVERTRGILGETCGDQETRKTSLRRLCHKWGVRVAPMGYPGDIEEEAQEAFETALCNLMEVELHNEAERVLHSLTRNETLRDAAFKNEECSDASSDAVSSHFANGYRLTVAALDSDGTKTQQNVQC